MRTAADIVGQVLRDVLACDEALTHPAMTERQREFERLAARCAPGSLGLAVADAIAKVLARVAQGLQGVR